MNEPKQELYTSCLSLLPDGAGFYYGYIPGDYRRIDVRDEGEVNAPDWVSYVAGEMVSRSHKFSDAEYRAIKWMRANPEQIDG